MGRKVIFMIALASMSLACFSQKNMDQLFSEFGKEKSVVRIKLGKICMGFAGLFTNTMGVNSIEVLSLNECSQFTKDNLVNAIKNLNDPDFETMVKVNNKDERTRVMVKMKENTIREMVVVTTSGNEHALIRIKGKISPSDVEKLVKEHSNG